MNIFLAILPLLIPLPILLAASAFFAGSETALFGLRQDERVRITKRGGIVAGALRGLLADQRMLLITVLLGNMTINVCYFVVCSVIVMQVHREQGPGWLLVLLPPLQLITIILLGEVVPKVLADRARTTWIASTAVALYTLHRLMAPIRVPTNLLIIEPLTRLTAPPGLDDGLDANELEDLLRLSASQGVIDDDEERLLGEVLQLSKLKVADIMVPRTEMSSLPASAGPSEVLALVAEKRLTKIPIHEGSPDRIVGMLYVKRYLALPNPPSAGKAAFEPVFVPEVASIENLIEELRRRSASVAIVVDEFGGTAGLVALEDALRPLLSESIEPTREHIAPKDLVEQLGPGAWRVPGRLRIRNWGHVLGTAAQAPGVSTLAGLVVSKLGRFPSPGESVTISNLRFVVEEVDGLRVEMIRVEIMGGKGVGEVAS